MPGILPSFRNIGLLVGSLYPSFIVCFLLLASIINLKYNGLIYLFGISLTIGSIFLANGAYNSDLKKSKIPVSCDLFNIGNILHPNLPNPQVVISWFTFVYLLIPMSLNNLTNPGVLFATLFFGIINAGFQFFHGCSGLSSIILGVLYGSLTGAGWWFAWHWKPELLFFNEIVSNNAICSRPTKQTFKCEVWKGGELVTQSTI